MTSRWEVTKAVRASDLSAPSRLILLVLADVAEVGTAEIPEKHTPSLTVLERETGLSRSTIKRRLADLELAGWVVRSYPDGPAMRRGERIRYRLEVPKGGSTVDLGVGSEAGSTESPGSTMDLDRVHSEPTGGSTVNPLIRSVPDQADQKTSTRSSVATGTRIPDDFAVTAEMIAWARRETPLVGTKETEAFVDYWRGRPGAAGRKTDWPATWRNWMRRAQADAERNRARAPAADGLIEHNGHRVRPEFASRAAMRERMAALDADRAQPAIEGGTG